ncbi:MULTISPECIES: hypothetical protein [unclassified Brevundimonas]|uniref:hypothetical protein n=1 Tax=unclassified Brevundimonas TaxID=2622653 RepID=UPI0025BE340D|nr:MULTISPECIES: hypothetical protein [unclassified Brevundimonas]
MIVLDLPSTAALALVALWIWRAAHRRWSQAQLLLSVDLFEDVAERREAAAALGLSPRAQERLLRRYYGAASWRLIRAAEARQGLFEPAAGSGGRSCDPVHRHD